MKFRWDNRYLHWGVTAFLVFAASMLFYYGIFHMRTLVVGLKSIIGMMAPIIYGIALAYLLSAIVNFLENNIVYPILKKKNIELQKRGHKAVRWVCVLLAFCIFCFIIYALVMMILPQLIRNVMGIIYKFPNYIRSVEELLNSFIERGNLSADVIDMLNQYSAEAQEYLTYNILPQMQNMLKNISAGVFDVLIFFKNFLIGAIISLYIIADKEILIAKSKMIVYAFFPTKWANSVVKSMRFTNRTFGGFFSGKILDSAIIGVLCYIGTALLDMPYAILISAIIGVTNIIPFFGPYVGAVPTVLLVLLEDPIKSLYLAIFILALQQFDGNILGPKILGDSTGLSSFMVIVAILVGGGLFGVPGMVVGVPVCAVVYAATWQGIQHVLIKKKMPADMTDFIGVDYIEPDTYKVVKMTEEKMHPKKENKANPDSIYMKIWNFVMKILLMAWKYIKTYSIKAFHISKEKYLILKEKVKKYLENKKKEKQE